MRYTTQQKKDALKLAQEIGAKNASEQLSISYQSLLAWRKQYVEDAAAGESFTAVSPDLKKAANSSKKVQSPELQVQLLRSEIVRLKSQLVRQSQAIQALSTVED